MDGAGAGEARAVVAGGALVWAVAVPVAAGGGAGAHAGSVFIAPKSGRVRSMSGIGWKTGAGA
ncbi:MAG: hypothetical protein ACK47O_00145, partial [Betaproteobacteria bacterium]